MHCCYLPSAYLRDIEKSAVAVVVPSKNCNSFYHQLQTVLSMETD